VRSIGYIQWYRYGPKNKELIPFSDLENEIIKNAHQNHDRDEVELDDYFIDLKPCLSINKGNKLEKTIVKRITSIVPHQNLCQKHFTLNESQNNTKNVRCYVDLAFELHFIRQSDSA
jgi:hypothetical protein